MENKVGQEQVSAGASNTISDEELRALNLSSRQIAILLSQNPEVQELNKIESFYDYEKEYVRIVRDIGRQAMEIQIGNVSLNRRKKNTFRVWRNRPEQKASVLYPIEPQLQVQSLTTGENYLCGAVKLL